MKSRTSGAAFFDLDFTLVNLNSSYDFVTYYLIQTVNLPKLVILIIFRLSATLGLTKVFIKEQRAVYFKFLKGETQDRIERVAQQYVDQRLYSFTNVDAFDILRSYKKKKYHTVLLSASLEPVVRAYAAKAAIDQSFASTLAYKNGICQGALDEDLSEKKHHKWNELEKTLGHSLDPSNCYFLSDNHEDYEMMRFIPSSQAVVYDSFQSRYWKDKKIATKLIPPNVYPLRFVFFLPATYYFHTRRPIQDLLLVHVPFFAAVFLLGLAKTSFAWPVAFSISWIGYICVYEIGYLVNDLIALKYETSPTLHLDRQTASFIKFYTFTRFLIVLAILLFSRLPGLSTGAYLIGIVTTATIFLLHNLLPRMLRLATFPILKLTHLIVPLLIFPLTYSPTATLVTAFFYLEKEMVYYYRKVRGLREWNSQLKLRFVIIPKLTILTVFFLASILNPHLLSFAVLGLALSVLEIGFVGKILLAKFRKNK